MRRGLNFLPRLRIRQRQSPLHDRLAEEDLTNEAPAEQWRTDVPSRRKVVTVVEDADIITFQTPAEARPVERPAPKPPAPEPPAPEPPAPAEVGIQPSEVDLGPSAGDYCLEARVTTTQQDAALMGKMMPRELYGPQSSPPGGRKMLVIRGGRLCWEVAGIGHLHGTRVISDGQEHKVAVAYSREEDRFTLYADGSPDGSGLVQNLEDHRDCKWAVGNSDRVPSWSMDPANCRFDSAVGTIAEVRWNGQLLLTGSSSPSSKPAYADGQCVEYFSRTHQLWMAGSMVTKVASDQSGSSLASYSVILKDTRQRRSAIGLNCLRLPLEPAEPCEYYLEEEDRWVQAQVTGAFVDTSRPTYELRVESEAVDEAPLAVPSVLVRRRFPKGSRVLIYRGLRRGWIQGTVMEEPGAEECRQEEAVEAEEEEEEEEEDDDFGVGEPVLGALLSDITVLPSPSQGTVGPLTQRMLSGTDGRQEYSWADVTVCEDGEETWRPVPCYLLRFHRDYLLKLAREQAIMENVQQVMDDLDRMSDPGIDGLDGAPEKLGRGPRPTFEVLGDLDCISDPGIDGLDWAPEKLGRAPRTTSEVLDDLDRISDPGIDGLDRAPEKLWRGLQTTSEGAMWESLEVFEI